jgi:hypothetical protein
MRVSEIGSATGAIKRPFQTAQPMACVRLARPSQRTIGLRRASLWRSSVGPISRWQSYTRKLPIKNGSPRAQCICSTRRIGINREQKCVPLSAPVGLFPGSTSKIKYIKNGWWAREDSNLQPSGYEPLALTIELRARATRAPARPDGFIATQTHDRLNDEGYATICHRLLMRPPQPGTSESGRSFTLGNDRDLHQQPDVRRGRSREAWRADASLRARRFVPVENAC